jgi:hypothetical protein
MHLVESTDREVRRIARVTRTPVQRGMFRGLIEAIVKLCGGAWAGGSGVAPRRMQVLETLSIGPKKQLLLVRCDGEKYLVATGPESVQTILRVEPRARVSGLGTMAPESGERS